MTQHQTNTTTNSRHPESAVGHVFGLGIATGILAILGSQYVFTLAGFMTVFALDGYPLVGLAAALYWVLAISMVILGILTIVRNRSWSSTLPLLLLGIAVLVVVFSLAGTLTGVTGGAWWLFSIVCLFPLIIVALLAYLSARKATLQPVG